MKMSFRLLACVACAALIPATDTPGAALGAGEVVSTGTLTDAYPVAPGEAWSTEFEGIDLSGLRVSFR